MFTEFFNELMEGRLVGLRCRDCGGITCPPKSTCDWCKGRNLEKVELSGYGKVVSYTTIYVAPMGYENEVPYVVALVELDEGPWIIGRLNVDAEVAERENLVGKRVKVYGKEFPSEIFYPNKEKRVVPIFEIV